MKQIVIFLFVTLFTSAIFSGTFKIKRTDLTVDDFTSSTDPNVRSAIQTKIDNLDDLFNKITDEVNSTFSSSKVSDYLSNEANAVSLAGKANHVDNASDLEYFTVGVGAGAVLSGDDIFDADAYLPSEDSLPSTGISLESSVSIGLNAFMLGLPRRIFYRKIDTKRLFFYTNMVYFEKSTDDFDVSMYDVGFHVQYKIIPTYYIAPFKLFTWTGINLTSGVTMSSLDIAFSQQFSMDRERVDEDKTTGEETKTTLTFTTDNSFQMGFQNKAFSIPIEASTGIQMLYFLTLYAGSGIDLNIGSSTTKADLNGDFTVELSEADKDKKNVKAGTGVLPFGESENSPYANLRFFLGTQINISLLKVYVQGTYALSGAFGVDFGLRVAY